MTGKITVSRFIFVCSCKLLLGLLSLYLVRQESSPVIFIYCRVNKTMKYEELLVLCLFAGVWNSILEFDTLPAVYKSLFRRVWILCGAERLGKQADY